MENIGDLLDLKHEVALIEVKKFGYGECKICFQDNVYLNNILMPCHHNGLCKDCADKLIKKPCPICRTYIKSSITVFNQIEDNHVEKVTLCNYGQVLSHSVITVNDAIIPAEEHK